MPLNSAKISIHCPQVSLQHASSDFKQKLRMSMGHSIHRFLYNLIAYLSQDSNIFKHLRDYAVVYSESKFSYICELPETKFGTFRTCSILHENPNKRAGVIWRCPEHWRHGLFKLTCWKWILYVILFMLHYTTRLLILSKRLLESKK